MYKALVSFTTKDTDYRINKVYEETDFASQELIDDLLQAEYIEPYTPSGGGGAEDYFLLDVQSGVSSAPGILKMIKALPDNMTIHGSVTSLNYAFAKCSLLTKIPIFDTSKITTMTHIFDSCSKLEEVPIFNTSKLTTMQDAFKSCGYLTNDSLNNIMQMCINATSYTGTKTLANIGLTSTQATTCQGLSNYQDFINAGWTTGY